MSRIILQYVLPLLLPVAVFLGWVLLTRGRDDEQGNIVSRLREGPWFWLIVAGVALMAGGLATLALTGGGDPGMTYVPPHREDGRVVPGQYK